MSGAIARIALGLLVAACASGSTGGDARELLDQGRYAEAVVSAREALAGAERLHGSESVEAANAIDLLVESLRRSGHAADPELRALARRAVRVKRAKLGPDDPALAPSLENLGLSLRGEGDYAEAISILERALSIREAGLGPDHPDVALTLNHLAWTVLKTGDLERARDAYERALKIREKALGPKHQAFASSLNNLAMVLKRQGEYAEARRHYERALQVYRGAVGTEHADFASTLHNLALLCRDQGDYAGARSRFVWVIRIWESALGTDHPRFAKALINLGLLDAEMGDPASAMELLQRALKIQRDKLDPNDTRIAATLDSLGTLYFSAGDLDRAEALQSRATEIRERAFSPKHSLVARSLHNLGAIHAERGDLVQAGLLFERALEIRKATLGPDHPKVASTLENLAELAHDTGSLARSRRRYEQALGIFETNFGNRHPKVAQVLQALSVVRAELDDFEGALDLALEAEAIGADHLRITAATLSDRGALRYASVRPAGQDTALSLLAGGKLPPAATRRVWDRVIRSRAVVLDEMKSRRNVTSETANLMRQLAEASERLGNLLAKRIERVSSRYQEQLLAVRQEHRRAELALARTVSSGSSDPGRSMVGLAAVAAALPPQASLVAWVRYEHHDSRRAPSYLALVLNGATSNPQRVRLGTADEIDRQVDLWRRAIHSAGSGLPNVGPASERHYRDVGTALRRAIWDPLVPHLKGSKQVFIVADGVLNFVNLATLPAGESRYLIEGPISIHHLNSERDLVEFQATTSGEARGLLIVGGPDFEASPAEPSEGQPGASTDCQGVGPTRFLPLHGAAGEVDVVAARWQLSVSPNEQAELVVLDGAEASEEAFRRHAPGRRILHIATHGFFDDHPCVNEPSARSSAESLLLADSDRAPSLSGLAFAGANRRRSPGGGTEDAILTADEVAVLDLEGAEWVVLSGCDTGLGEVMTGEGVLGLRRSFGIAGARTIIMSLWPVGDLTSREWMRHLYDGRAGDLSSTEAVRRAARRVLDSRRSGGRSTHPFHWGAFVAAGDWR